MTTGSEWKAGTAIALRDVAAVFTCVFALFAAPEAHANINLEFRPALQTTFVGNVFSIDLYSVSDDLSNQTTSAAQVIITWDTTFVQLLGLDNTGTPMTTASFFGPEPYGLNSSLTDGDAMWIGLAPPGNPVPATPLGTFLTSFSFLALAPTFPGTTLIDIAATGGMSSSGQPGQTIVYDGVTPNTDVTGTLTGSMVQVLVPGPGGLSALMAGLLLGSRPRRT
jgi:hypothetical protein